MVDFNVFAGNGIFSSMTCPSLSSSMILHIPHTHILFSLASSAPNITSQELKTADGHPFSLTHFQFQPLKPSVNAPTSCIKQRKRSRKEFVQERGPADLSQFATTAVVEALEVDSEDEEVEDKPTLTWLLPFFTLFLTVWFMRRFWPKFHVPSSMRTDLEHVDVRSKG